MTKFTTREFLRDTMDGKVYNIKFSKGMSCTGLIHNLVQEYPEDKYAKFDINYAENKYFRVGFYHEEFEEEVFNYYPEIHDIPVKKCILECEDGDVIYKIYLEYETPLTDFREFVHYVQSIKDTYIEKRLNNDPSADGSINYGTLCDILLKGYKLLEKYSGRDV